MPPLKRKIVHTFRRITTDPRPKVRVVFQLLQGTYTADDSFPPDRVSVETGPDGSLSVDLWCNSEGDRPVSYLCTLPDRSFLFVLPPGEPITLAALEATAQPSTTEQHKVALQLIEDHTHDYAASSHTHDYAASSHTHDYAASSHAHDYAASNHTHNYAPADHTHDDTPTEHTHNEYAAVAASNTWTAMQQFNTEIGIGTAPTQDTGLNVFRSITGGSTSNLYGLQFTAIHGSTQNVGFAYGVRGAAFINNTGGASNLAGGYFECRLGTNAPVWITATAAKVSAGAYPDQGKNLTGATGLIAEVVNGGPGTIGDARGIHVLSPSNTAAGVIERAVGVLIDRVSAALSNLAIWTKGGTVLHETGAWNVVGLIVKAATGQTANLLELHDPGGSPITSFGTSSSSTTTNATLLHNGVAKLVKVRDDGTLYVEP